MHPFVQLSADTQASNNLNNTLTNTNRLYFIDIFLNHSPKYACYPSVHITD